MKVKLSSTLYFLFAIILSCMCLTSSLTVSASNGAEPSNAIQSVNPASPSPEKKPANNSSKQWIYFAVTSGLSLAVAIPLAIHSGNKKYGK